MTRAIVSRYAMILVPNRRERRAFDLYWLLRWSRERESYGAKWRWHKTDRLSRLARHLRETA